MFWKIDIENDQNIFNIRFAQKVGKTTYIKTKIAD